MESESTTITTSETFNYPNADVIIRSSAPNKVDFRVHKFILSLSSSFFETMFTLPDASQKAPKTNLPVVDVSEPADTIDPLLRIIYPSIPDPTFDTLDKLRLVLQAAHKFEMHSSLGSLRHFLLTPVFLEKEPLRVYALAASYDFEDEAKVASRHTLRFRLADYQYSEEMKSMSGYYYHRLVVIRATRENQAKKLIQACYLRCASGCDGGFFNDWKLRAEIALSDRPISTDIFKHHFIYRNRRTCSSQSCDRFEVLENLKERIDNIPDTF
ncbi:hypothetical protein C8Q75DRAFT_77326 [Abortiporus biennis]|nr:hypothetical protein C8Q75DRAFT_77326 [Abortiporus biennis]